MGERLLCKQEVIGSIPFTSTNSLVKRAAKRLREQLDDERYREIWKILRYLVVRLD